MHRFALGLVCYALPYRLGLSRSATIDFLFRAAARVGVLCWSRRPMLVGCRFSPVRVPLMVSCASSCLHLPTHLPAISVEHILSQGVHWRSLCVPVVETTPGRYGAPFGHGAPFGRCSIRTRDSPAHATVPHHGKAIARPRHQENESSYTTGDANTNQHAQFYRRGAKASAGGCPPSSWPPPRSCCG